MKEKADILFKSENHDVTVTAGELINILSKYPKETGVYIKAACCKWQHTVVDIYQSEDDFGKSCVVVRST